MFRSLTGIHIQWPWSQLILTGEKTVETRAYPLPPRLQDVELALIETPGPRGKKMANIETRIVGTIVFSGSKQYETFESWQADYRLHKVSDNDIHFRFGLKKESWGWTIAKVHVLPEPLPPPEVRGIVYARNCKIGSSQSF